jgi:hypothetical protein
MSPNTAAPAANEGAVYDDEISPPSSISAQVLAPFLNAPVPSTFKNPPPIQSAGSTAVNGMTRGASARATALGSLSRSSSVKRSSRRSSNEDNSLTSDYLALIGEGNVDETRLEKIRCLARDRGVPNNLRKYVWPILLSHCLPQERVREDVVCDEDLDRIAKITKRIRGELSRYHRRKARRGLPQSSSVTPSAQTTTPPAETSGASSIASSPNHSPPQTPSLEAAPLDLAVESTIVTFLSTNPDIDYSPGMVYLALTLGTWIFLPSATLNIPGFEDPHVLLRNTFYSCLALFGQLPTPCYSLRSSRQNSTISINSIIPPNEASKFPATHRISQFLSAFRTAMPELATVFDDEGIGGWGDDWVGGWVGWFCAKELYGKVNEGVKARLWDVYFSYPCVALDETGRGFGQGPGEELHIYVCIALLKSCADALEVLEQSEIRTLLQQLPPVDDVEGILKEAMRIKELVLVKEKEEEEGYLGRRSSGGSKSGSEKS